MTCAAHMLAVSRAFLNWEDVDLIGEAVRMLPSRKVKVYDLGAGSGTTALSIFAARTENIEVVTVDHSDENLHWAELAIQNAGYAHLWSFTNRRSWELPEEADLVLIDTDHEYETTCKELDAWLPHTSLLWMHDYRGLYPGVPKAVNERIAAGFLKTIRIAGLGWLGEVIH